MYIVQWHKCTLNPTKDYPTQQLICSNCTSTCSTPHMHPQCQATCTHCQAKQYSRLVYSLKPCVCLGRRAGHELGDKDARAVRDVRIVHTSRYAHTQAARLVFLQWRENSELWLSLHTACTHVHVHTHTHTHSYTCTHTHTHTHTHSLTHSLTTLTCIHVYAHTLACT